ncbi:Asp/Glu racemase [Rhodobacteraceae bacterium CCMM004]|nr:Asp/Glu racemase [Rhodobacteraceae bacterium CCMM004]
MEVFAYTLAPPGPAPLGLIVLQADRVIERDMARLLPRAALHVSRVTSGLEVGGDTLAAMARDLPAAAGLLPRGVGFGVVGYGCTSGTAVIGAARVAALIREGAPAAHVSDPLTALTAACRALRLRRLALLSPYVAEVSDTLRAALVREGIATPVFGTFAVAEEARVAAIDAASIRRAALSLAAQGGADALFLSCTNLDALDLIAPLEAEASLPVLSSNQVLAWHMAALAGVAAAVPGRLGQTARA